MKILVINAGSSSLKFTLFSMTKEEMLASGQVERLGTDEPNLIYKRPDGYKVEDKSPIKDYQEALKRICDKLLDPQNGVIKSLKEVQAIGHRVVHGGEKINKPARVDANVKAIIKECISLAPLHNPPNLGGIEACESFFPGVPNVAVFDTAFHQTMTPEAYLYAVPYELYTKYGVRRYGFHGTSHHYVALSTAAFFNSELSKLNLITCHLGNGCSMAAIQNGKVIDTTMGMTPLEGLVMGTRCGDIDPAVVLRLAELGIPTPEIDKILNKKSGLLGVSGKVSDMRDLVTACEGGDKQAELALNMFVRRVVKYIGSYHVLLGHTDAIVFTGGIGEYSNAVRGRVVNSLKALGISLDVAANDKFRGKAGIISTEDSKLKVLVMPTNEELMIAQSVKSLLA